MSLATHSEWRAAVTNVVVLGGNLTADPELRYTASGTAVATLRLANNQFGDDEPLFINVTAWEKLADACAERLRKGHKIVVHGSLKPESWTATDGTKRNAISIRAVSIEFMQSQKPVSDDGFTPEGDVPRALDPEREPTGLPF